MGSKFFKPTMSPGAPKVGTSMNMEARALGGPAYNARSAGMAAQKDLGAAAGLGKTGLKPGLKTAASNAPGPKKL